MVDMTETFGSASDIQIASFEKRNGIALPDDYRAFLRDCNGGEPKLCEFAVPGWNILVVHFFLGLDVDEDYELQQNTDAVADVSNSDFIPIAVDAGGWYVFLRVKGPGSGAVFFIDTKKEDAEPIKIAASFTDFASRLAPEGTFDDYEYGLPPKKTG